MKDKCLFNEIIKSWRQECSEKYDLVFMVDDYDMWRIILPLSGLNPLWASFIASTSILNSTLSACRMAWEVSLQRKDVFFFFSYQAWTYNSAWFNLFTYFYATLLYFFLVVFPCRLLHKLFILLSLSTINTTQLSFSHSPSNTSAPYSSFCISPTLNLFFLFCYLNPLSFSFFLSPYFFFIFVMQEAFARKHWNFNLRWAER